ncbi:MAG: cupin domain-containing protein [Clostridia bacterium]|nr:cupin domain-containing protein [Clostridia bacterium]
MKLLEILAPDFVFEDERGCLSQITHEPFAQVNSVFTKKGAVRGNYHYHKTTKEAFFVFSGEIKVSLYLNEQKEEYFFKTGDMFLIHENVRHRFEFLEDTRLVVFYTSRVELEDGTKDIINDE